VKLKDRGPWPYSIRAWSAPCGDSFPGQGGLPQGRWGRLPPTFGALTLLAIAGCGDSWAHPYSLRHGYAWRGHKAYERSIHVRDLAALMGHYPATHHLHYGRWIDEVGLDEAAARALGPALSIAE